MKKWLSLLLALCLLVSVFPASSAEDSFLGNNDSSVQYGGTSEVSSMEELESSVEEITLELGENEQLGTVIEANNSVTYSIDDSNFPDPNFRAYVLGTIDIDGNGSLSDTEINAVTSIDCSSRKITSLKGVELFSSLTNLNCMYNKLTALDVSQNKLLTTLICDFNRLASLDVSQNSALQTLECDSNPLGILDVSNNRGLTKLSCTCTELNTIDVSNNTVLEWLACDTNEIEELDVSHNLALKVLDCGFQPLRNLNVSHNSALTWLRCGPSKLSSLDIRQSAALETLYCDRSELTSLDVSHNIALKALYCDNNHLTTLDVSHNTALKYLVCDYNQLSALDVSHNIELSSGLSCSNNQLTVLDVSHNTSLERLTCEGNKLHTLDITNCPKLVNCFRKGERSIPETGVCKYSLTSSEFLSMDDIVTVIDGGSAQPTAGTPTLAPPSSDELILSTNSSKTINVGDTLQIVLKGQTAKSYKSSSPKIASVSSTGLIKALKVGNTTITVTLTNKKKLKLKLAVIDPKAVTKVSLSATGTIKMQSGKTLTLRATLTPSTAESPLSWKSSNEKVATVKDGKVDAIKEGTAKITVTANNKKSASVSIKVSGPSKIMITNGKSVDLTMDYALSLNTIIEPEGVISPLTWKSSNPKVASVSKDGVVYPVKIGSTRITVATNNNKKATITINVVPPVVERSDLETAVNEESTNENIFLREWSIRFAMDAYNANKKDSLKYDLESLGFVDDVLIVNPFNFNELIDYLIPDHRIGYAFGYRDIIGSDGNNSRLFIIVCRGTGSNGEWGSDFTIGTGERMRGFDEPAKAVYNSFLDYRRKHGGTDKDKVWITGHSRGAAVANLLAGYYIPLSKIKDENIYCYTFACPNVSKGNLGKKNNIFNYNLKGDLIPYVPFEKWEYKRYGRSIDYNHKKYIGNKRVVTPSATKNVANYFATMTDKNWVKICEFVNEEILPTADAGSISHFVALRIIISYALGSASSVLSLLPVKRQLEKDLKEVTLYLGNTHPSETYYQWIIDLGNKKLFK